MSLRFINTDLFDKQWYLELSDKGKTAWLYLNLKCNHAGIFHIASGLATFQTGIKDWELFIEKEFENRLIKLGRDEYFIPSFISDQYPKGLTHNVSAQRSVVDILTKRGLFLDGCIRVPEGLDKGSTTLQDKEEDKDKEEEEDLDLVVNSRTDTCTEILNYLNLKSKKSYRPVPSNLKFIKARLNEGYSTKDFITVIDKKVDEWIDNVDMNKYLRPETLFGNKFDNYLNQQVIPKDTRPPFISQNPQWINIIQWFNSGLINDETKIRNMKTNGTINDREMNHLLSLLEEV